MECWKNYSQKDAISRYFLFFVAFFFFFFEEKFSRVVRYLKKYLYNKYYFMFYAR